MIACFVRRQHASALSWIADRAGRIASLLLPQVGDVHDLFRGARRLRGSCGWGRISGSRRRSSIWAGGRPCVATDLKPSSSATHSTPNFAWQMRVAFASMVSNTGFSSPGELESFSGPRLVSSTARRHGISTSLLFTLRRTYRYGTFAVAPIV